MWDWFQKKKGYVHPEAAKKRCGKWISDQPRAWEQHYWYYSQCRPAQHIAGDGGNASGHVSKPKAAQKSKAEPPESVQQRPQDPKQVLPAAATQLAGLNLRADNSASSSTGAVALPNFLVALANLQMEL